MRTTTANDGATRTKRDNLDAARDLNRHIGAGKSHGVALGLGSALDADGNYLPIWFSPQARALYDASLGFEVGRNCPVCLVAFEAARPESAGGFRGDDGVARIFCSPAHQALDADKRRQRPREWGRCDICATGFQVLVGPKSRRHAARRRICPGPWPANPSDATRSPCWEAYKVRSQHDNSDRQRARRLAAEGEGRLALKVRAALANGHVPTGTAFQAGFPNLTETRVFELNALVMAWAAHNETCGGCAIERWRYGHRFAPSVERAEAGIDPGQPPRSKRRTKAVVEAERIARAAARVGRATFHTNAVQRRAAALLG